jgi:5'-nucleotidase (lipoprotein e(P4) family)
VKRCASLIGAAALLAGCAATRQATGVASAPAVEAPAAPPPGMQYLYGSGEAVALSRQAYNALVDHVRGRLASERANPAATRTSMVLRADASLEQPAMTPCTPEMPRAAVFDMDETVALNIGEEYAEARAGGGFDAARWARWEQERSGRAAAAVPGAVEAFYELRRMGVAIIINTNRSAASAEATTGLLKALELGDFRHGETLFLRGDVDGKGGKDGRRVEIARHYCVIAMAGDQLGDFSDRFAGPAPQARRVLAQSPAIWGLWARGWFILPNPVYGTGLAGDWDQIFPADTRWTDPKEGTK